MARRQLVSPERDRGFVATLSHLAQRRHGEDQLSNAFAACFNSSANFRANILRMMRASVDAFIPSRAMYVCRTQQWEKVGNKHDIVLWPIVPSAPKHVVVLESKVDAPLTAEQLLRYRSSTGRPLAVITRDYPQVGAGWLRHHGITAFRWHDIYRVLLNSKPRGKERFVRDEFLRYLEDLGMAFQEVRRDDLKGIAKQFRGMSKERYYTARMRFGAIDDVLGFLDELKRELEDSLGRKNVVLSGWGSGYYNETDYNDDGEATAKMHYLGFNLRRKKSAKWRHKTLEVALQFPEKEGARISLVIYAWDRKRKIRSGDSITPIGSAFDATGALDMEKLFRTVRKQALKHQKTFL